jgi:hypothetical protein
MDKTGVRNVYLVCLSDYYYKNRIFDIESPQNRDHAYEPYHLLRKKFQERGIALNTYDYFKGGEPGSYALLFIDIPRNMEKIAKRHPGVDCYLLLIESGIISPESWQPLRHKYFKKIFTWNDTLAGSANYVKIQVPSWFQATLSVNSAGADKLCVMIAGNRSSVYPSELYSERVKVIRWFEANHPEDFDLYGFGWDERRFTGPRLVRLLNRSRFIRRLSAPKFPSFRGSVVDKLATLKKYRFAICYENVRDVPGYITEKIFDCFFAGCIPVYRGADNVTDHIPKECFIDKRDFPEMAALHKYISLMDEQTYQRYLANIRAFLASPQAAPFTAEYFAGTIVAGVTG